MIPPDANPCSCSIPIESSQAESSRVGLCSPYVRLINTAADNLTTCQPLWVPSPPLGRWWRELWQRVLRDREKLCDACGIRHTIYGREQEHIVEMSFAYIVGIYSRMWPHRVRALRDVGQRVGRRAGAASVYYWVSRQSWLSRKPTDQAN